MNRHAKAPSAGSKTRPGRRPILVAAFVVLATLILGVSLAAATAPTVSVENATNVRYTTAHVEGEVDPADHETSYHFEYATDAQFTATEWAEASSAGFGSLGEGAGLTPVETGLEGLAPGTTYHLRLVAENNEAERVEAVAAATFTTEAVAKPSVSVDPVATFTATSAHFVGHVNPNAPEAEGFTDAAEQGAFKTSWHFQCVAPGPSCGNLSGDAVPAGNASEEVHADATGLEPNTAYYVKLVASNAGGSEEAVTIASPSFTTATEAPGVVTGTNTPDLGGGGVTVRAYVNPHNSTITNCHFAYGPTAGYGVEVPCEEGAAVPAPLVSGNEPVEVAVHLTGLALGSTYHFQVTATSAAGTTPSADGIFAFPAAEPNPTCANAVIRSAQHATYLPDCRAYEQVSPPDKNGGDVMADPQRVHVATDGSAVAFPSLSGFGDVQGGGYSVEYMSERSTSPEPGTNGWLTHAITPPQASLAGPGLHVEPLYVGDMSPDLSAGVFSAWSPLTNDPDVANAVNLYTRTDLLSKGHGSYGLLTSCPLCAGTPLPPLTFRAESGAPHLAGTAADLSHVVFESRTQLTPGAPGNCTGVRINVETLCPTKLYESDHGAVRLAGVLPDGTPAPRSIAGQGASEFYAPHVISNDGSRISFTVPSTPSGLSGDLYLRTGNGTPGAGTVQINASERTDCADHSPCNGTPELDPGGLQPATYWDASADGSRIFFTSPEALTDDAPLGNVKLYMYDANQPDSAPHNLTLLTNANETLGVIGASDDGRFVYFVNSGPLIPGQPAVTAAAVYLWRDDGTTARVEYVAAIADLGSLQNDLFNAPPGFGGFNARVTPDGHSMLLADAEPGPGPIGYDQGTCNTSNAGLGCRELYLFSADTGGLTCVSCRPDGMPATADAATVTRTNTSASRTTFHINRALADDGQRVFFNTGEALVKADTNDVTDVYEYDVPSGTVHLISSGTAPSPSYLMDASSSGEDVFFLTSQKLVGWDTDTNYDLYDARVSGGFPEPTAHPAPCEGEACRPSSGPPPGQPSAASGQFTGPGNPKRPPACRKGQVRRNGRCVKKKHPKKSARRAAAHKRGGQK